jgi:hypothetical protein
MNLCQLLSHFAPLALRHAVPIRESTQGAFGQLRPPPRVDQYGAAVARRPRSDRLVLKDGVFGAREDEVLTGIESSGGRSAAEVAHLPSRERLNYEHLPIHRLSPSVLSGERGLEFRGGHTCFCALIPRHLGSVGAVDLDEVSLAGPTREREQTDAFGTALARRRAFFLKPAVSLPSRSLFS